VEKEKFIPEKRGGRRLSFRAVRGSPTLWGLLAAVCIDRDIKLWKRPDVFFLAIIDEQRGQAVGFVILQRVSSPHGDLLTAPGLEPSVELLSEVDSADLYPVIEEALIELADIGGSTDSSAHQTNMISNRPGMLNEVVARSYPTMKLANDVECAAGTRLSWLYRIWSVDPDAPLRFRAPFKRRKKERGITSTLAIPINSWHGSRRL